MCTCCQNWTNGVGVNSVTVSGCNNGVARMGCARTGYGCARTSYGCVQNRSVGCACGCHHGCGSRYITFPISGTAVVPTSSIYFYPTTWGNSGYFGGQTSNVSNGGCANGCGFGRCGGAAAIANFNEDYYARQYGLND